MTRQEIETILARRFEAMQHGDAATVAAMHSEDSVFTSMLVGTIQGRKAIESLHRDFFSAFPEAVFDLENQIIDGNRAAV